MSSDSTASQAAYYVGLNLQAILYGIEVCLYSKTMHIYLSRRRARRKSDMFYMVFSSVMFALITIWVALVGVFGQEAWLPNQNYLGGVDAYVERRAAYTLIDIAAASIIILQQMTDGLMIYRCRIVWDSLRVIIIPSILWLIAFASGILALWISSAAQSNFFTGDAVEFGLAFYSISIFLQVTVTSMICYRLVCYAKTMKEHFGEEYAAPYFSVMRLLVESVLPYSLAGIAFLVSYGVGSPSEAALSLVYVSFMCVSPQMLILRVAQGNAWRKDSIKPPLSVMMFPSRSGDTSASGDMDGSIPVTHVESLPGVSPPGSGKGNKV